MSQEAVADIVAAYLENTNNRDMTPEQLVNLIGSVAQSLNPKAQGMKVTMDADVIKSTTSEESSERKAKEPKTPQEIAESITEHHIISFIDGSKLKTLKRHLTTNDYTEQSYKTHFGLPHDYPMVAPSYSRERSEMSLKLGLGRKKKNPEVSEAPAKVDEKPSKGKVSTGKATKAQNDKEPRVAEPAN